MKSEVLLDEQEIQRIIQVVDHLEAAGLLQASLEWSKEQLLAYWDEVIG